MENKDVLQCAKCGGLFPEDQIVMFFAVNLCQKCFEEVKKENE